MANSNNITGGVQEDRTGNGGGDENRGNKKLPDNPRNDPEESISTAGDTSDGKYSNTDKRDDEIDNDDTRGVL